MTMLPRRDALRSLRGLAALTRSHPGILWGLFGGTLGKVATFAGGIVLASLLTTLEYGEFAAVHLTTYSIAGIFSSGVAIAVNTLGATETRRRTMSTVALVGATLCAGVAIPSFPFLLDWLAGADSGAFATSHTLGLVPAAVCFGSASLSALSGRGQVREAACIEIARGVFGAAGIVVIGVTLGPIPAVYSIAIVDMLVGVAGLLRTKRLDRPHPAVWRSSIRLSAAGIGGAALAQSGFWIAQATLAREYGLEGLAAYGVALRFANLILLPPNFIARNALGDLRRTQDTSGWLRVFRVNGAVTLALGVITLATVMLLSVTLFRPLIDRYEASWVLTALGIVTTLRVVSNFLGTASVSRDLRKAWLASDLGGALLMIATSVAIARMAVPLPIYILGAFGVPAIFVASHRILALRRNLRDSGGTS